MLVECRDCCRLSQKPLRGVSVPQTPSGRWFSSASCAGDFWGFRLDPAPPGSARVREFTSQAHVLSETDLVRFSISASRTRWQSWMVISFLLRALRVRKKTGGEKMPVQMIGDILAAELSHMQAYIRFCSCQLNGASLLQQKTDEDADFKDYLKVSYSVAFEPFPFLDDRSPSNQH